MIPVDLLFSVVFFDVDLLSSIFTDFLQLSTLN